MTGEEAEQMSLFRDEPRAGEYAAAHGPRIGWDELRPGMVVILDQSTQSHEWLRVTVVEKIVRTPDDLRVILNGRRGCRPLINRRYIDSGAAKLYKELN